jgi:hypothetical protein
MSHEMSLQLAILTALVKEYGPIPTVCVGRRLSAASVNRSRHWGESPLEPRLPAVMPMRFAYCVEKREIRLSDGPWGSVIHVITAVAGEYELEALATQAVVQICTHELRFFIEPMKHPIDEREASRILNVITADGTLKPEDVLGPRGRQL